MADQTLLQAIANEEHQIVDVTRREARELLTDWLEGAHTQLEQALDTAQGEADEEGKDAYLVIRIKGAAL